MRAKPLGCLTPAGILAVLVTLLVIGVAAVAQGGEIFSPGGLSARTGRVLGGVDSHEMLGGNCTACHTAPWNPQTMTSRCLECHTHIEDDLLDSASLHGGLIEDPTSVDCRACHTEHHGPLASLTSMRVDDFPHDRTGYSLLAHAEKSDGRAFTCGDCHGERLELLEQAVCLDCHEKNDPDFQINHPAFGANCLACHDGVDTYGAAFDHVVTRFPLDGKHSQAACLDCHAGMSSLQQLRDTPQDCFACHAQDDAHSGQMGSDCAVCHTSGGWQPAVFDHTRTGFDLVGKHADAECSDCHMEQNYREVPSDCFSCHAQDDSHDGQLGRDCAVCHSPSGWKPATFDHAQSAFPLTGAHSSVDCAGCHVNGQYKDMPTSCAGCHSDPAYHSGLFGSNCADCHNTAGWLPASFDRSHPFPVNHGRAGSCHDCHTSTLSAWTCYTCHDAAEIDKEHRKEGISDYANCLRCHPDGREGDDNGGDDNDDDDDD